MNTLYGSVAFPVENGLAADVKGGYLSSNRAPMHVYMGADFNIMIYVL